MYKPRHKNCQNCSKDYWGSPKSKYCSRFCASKYNKTQFQKGIVPWNKGVGCSQETKAKISLKNKGKGVGIRPKNFDSFQKKGWFANLGRKVSLETKKKMSEAHSGEKAYQWEGGITKVSTRIRNGLNYRQWRSDIFIINDFTCQECGQRGGRLHADHIEPFCVIFARNHIETFEQAIECEELWNLNNGRTLCVECHKKTDTYLSGATKYKKAVLSPLQITSSV